MVRLVGSGFQAGLPARRGPGSRPPPHEITENPVETSADGALATLDQGSRARLLRNVAVLGGSQVVTWTVSFAWTLVIPRTLGPAAMGLLVLNWSAIGVMTVLAGLGTKVLLVREIAADRSRAPHLLGTALYLRGLLLLPAFAATMLYVRLGAFDQQRSLFILLAYAATVVVLLTEPIQAAFQGIERMEYLALGDVLIKTCGAAGAIVLVLAGQGALALVILALALSWVVLLLYVALILRYVRLDLRFVWSSVIRLFRQSLAFWAFGVFFTIYLWIDSMMLALLARPEALGWYGAPTKLFGTLMFAPIIVSTAWLPRLSLAFKQSADAFRSVARPLLEIVLVLCLPVSVGAALVAPALINVLYGPGYGPSVPVFVILAFTTIPMYLNIVVNQILVSSHRQTLWTFVMAGASIVNPALNAILIPLFERNQHNGAVGAALALLLTEALIVGVGLTVVRRTFTWHTALRLVRTLIATSGMAVAVLLVARVGLAAQIGAGVISFALLGWALRLVSRAEAHDLLALLRNRKAAASEVGQVG
jgi:O-antigen/teichoic acid export membrane protein